MLRLAMSSPLAIMCSEQGMLRFNALNASSHLILSAPKTAIKRIFFITDEGSPGSAIIPAGKRLEVRSIAHLSVYWLTAPVGPGRSRHNPGSLLRQYGREAFRCDQLLLGKSILKGPRHLSHSLSLTLGGPYRGR